MPRVVSMKRSSGACSAGEGFRSRSSWSAPTTPTPNPTSGSIRCWMLLVDERVEPQDLDAEKSVLGAMMLSQTAVWDALSILQPDDFYGPKHALVFTAAAALAQRNEPVDAISVADELGRTGELERAGQASYMHELTAFVPTAANAGYYAAIVRQKAVKRHMIAAGTRIVQRGFAEEGEALEALEAGRADLDRVVRGAVTDVSPVGWAYDHVVDFLGKQPRTVPTPWPVLDDLMGGLRPGALYVIGARPGDGKTLAGLQIAQRLASNGPVAFSSLEMSQDELMQRIISNRAGVHMSTLGRHSLTQTDWERVATVRSEIVNLPLFVDDRSGVTITHIKSFARSVSRKGDRPIAGVVVDYLQLVSGTDSAQKRFEIVSEVSRQLKIMARELGCPVVALSQLNRESAGVGKLRRAPSLADLRESGSIEQDADVVLLLQRQVEKDGQPADRLDVHVAKNRHGRTGRRTLLWQAQFARLSVFPQGHLFDVPID